MIEDPPLITLARPRRRPDPEALAALNNVPTGFLADALGGRGALGPAVKPTIPGQDRFTGVALPCHAGPADNLAVFAALTVLQPGDVVVAAADGFRGTAVTGDLLLGMAKNLGAVAFVSDGCVRDLEGLAAVGLPCFATGVTPASPARNGPGTVGLPVVLTGQRIEAGDVVVGDPDGVVVVPYHAIDEVVARLEGIKAAEAALDAKVKGGLGVPDFIEATLKGRIREID
jgi:4-hydroxy-4-methyl-2-oxoglutarate aldolase